VLDATLLTSTDWALWAIGLGTGAATLFGGIVALRLKASTGLLFGLASGAVLGVVLFDLLPEALRLGAPPAGVLPVLTAVACGFAVYLLVHRLAACSDHGRGLKAHLGAGALTLHSLIDGLGIGLAFKASAAVGAGVAFAVLAHDCLDGANTVTLSLSGGAGDRTARRWLVADALAPLAGIALSRLISVPRETLELLLGGFAGFFLYIGTSELLPQALARRPKVSTSFAAVAGLTALYAVVRLAGGG
jgi:ZIP family zinc transporter